MLAGKNYISSTTVPTAARPDFDTQNKDNDIMMGESLTVKGTQLAYLAPAEILYDGELHNPMSFDEYSTVMLQEMVPEDKREIPIESLGGKTLKDIGVDTETPVQKVFYNNSKSAGGGYVYFYLNFTNDSNAASFMQQQYQNIKTNMDEYLSFYFGKADSGIRVNDTKTYLRYITNGNVLSYDSGEAEGELKVATDSVVTDQLRQEQTNYQNMWYALNRKMISSYDLLKTQVKDSDGLIHNETDLSQSVYDNLVNEKNMVQFIKENHNDGEYQYKFTAEDDENKPLEAIMVHNGKSSTFKVVNEAASTEDNLVTEEVTVGGSDKEFEIDEALAESLRLLVCTGDVRIKSNVNFYGIIMAKGKITLESGAQLISSPLEAAKVFQYQIASGDYSPKDFFWEGDKYVLGNSITTGDTTETGYTTSTYDLADCITYENWKKK